MLGGIFSRRAPAATIAAKPSVSGQIGICVVSSDAAFARGLANAFRVNSVKRFFGRGANTAIRTASRNDADICIYSFTVEDFAAPGFVARHNAAIATDPAGLKVFLELVSTVAQGPELIETQKKNVLIAQLAAANTGQLIPLMSKFLRWGPSRLMTKSGEMGMKGYLAIANAVGKIADQHVVRTGLRTEDMPATAREADASSTERARAILAQLRWNEPALPRLLKMPFHAGAIGDFLDGNISFYSYPSWGKVTFAVPLDWAMPGPNRSWQSYFLGLEFVNAVLAYWFAASGRDRAAIETLLKNHGAGRDVLLERAGAVIADFVRNNPPDAPSARRAWHEGTVSRRLRTMLTYLLCCKQAEARGVAYDADAVVLAHRGVLDSIEFLGSDSVYVKAGNHGVRQDALLIVASLLLSGGEEGKRYLRDGLVRLSTFQLERALSPDGVWLENSFGYHCLVMGMLSNLAADMRAAGERGVDPLLDAIERMCGFVEATIKVDGTPPLIGDTEPKYYIRALFGARRLLRDFRADDEDDTPRATDPASLVRAKDTYFFPDAGFFVSHAGRTLDPAGSSVILYATLRTPKHKHSDDLSVIFAHGATDLLIDGGTYNKEIGDQVRNAARFDPASHNTYRVNGKGYDLRSVKGSRSPAGLSDTWAGDGWAAAQGFNTAYPDGEVRRLVIHFKAHSAVLVVDRLESKTREPVTFEQFWHVAPQFAATQTAAGFRFASQADGCLSTAFDEEPATVAVEHGGPDNPLAWLMVGDEKTVPTPYVRRAKSLTEGTMAAAFQWTKDGGALSIAVSGAADALQIRATGAAFDEAFVMDRKGLRRVGR